jgi:hypothetical protein
MIIYAMSSPVTGKVRYIGITKQTLKERIRQHIKSAKSGTRLPVAYWIRSLIGKSLTPEVSIIEETDDYSREAYWISEHGGTKKLLNVLDGTENSPAQCAKAAMGISRALRGRKLSQAHREKLSAAHKGKKLSPEVIAKITERMQSFRHTEETKQKMRKPKSESHRIAAAAALKKCREDGKYNLATGDSNGMRLRPESILHGSSNGNAKLTEADVVDMREKHSSGMSTVKIAKEFKIAQATAWKIVNKLAWKHV